jgi:cystathionine gamma-synthase
MFMNKHLKKTTKESYIRIVDFVISPTSVELVEEQTVLNILFFPSEYSSLAKEFWQHTGLGVSSRFAEYCLVKLGQELPKIPFNVKSLGGTSRTKVEQQVTDSHSQIIDQQNEKIDASLYIEERFGRNLTLDLANEAKLVLRKRIAGSMVNSDDQTIESNRVSAGVTFHDVKLFPSGMSAIYAAHKVAISLNPELKTIQFGFPYIDTLKLQEKFGNGVIFYGNGNDEDLAKLKLLLENTQIAAVFCEFPSNPLLKSPPLKELWKLAQEHNFLIIVDETIGNFVNTNVLSFSHIVVSSLTKIFSGDSNVMGGSLVINPKSNLYTKISSCLNGIYADNLWFEDAIYLERNSRQFINRIKLINTNAEILCDLLKTHPLGKFAVKYSISSILSKIYHPRVI